MSDAVIHIHDSVSARLVEMVELVQRLLVRRGSPLPAKVLEGIEGPGGLLQVVSLGSEGDTCECAIDVQVNERYWSLVAELRAIERSNRDEPNRDARC